jgi:acetoin utilization deacetylase AcuC-like enzyme
MQLGVVLDEVFLVHRPPAGHPESPERVRVLLDLPVLSDPRILRVTPVEAEDRLLLAVHTAEHVELIQETTKRSLTMLDPDTYAGPETWRVARIAAGSAARLLDLMKGDTIAPGFLAARPPGHHAESNRAMGFCFFNQAAVAAQHALDQGLAKRVAIFDFDVHHGNGTQEIFWERDDVLYISVHQYPFYPGTGSAAETGSGPGKGFTLNLPLSAGANDAVYLSLVEERVIPVLRDFSPDLLVVSAGYDAHRSDPLGGMNLSTEAYRRMVFRLQETAGGLCRGRVLYVLEGGYDLQALRDCVQGTLEACLEFLPESHG